MDEQLQPVIPVPTPVFDPSPAAPPAVPPVEDVPFDFVPKEDAPALPESDSAVLLTPPHIPGEGIETSLNANKILVIMRALKACEQNIGNVVRLLEKELASPAFPPEAHSDADLDVNAVKEMEIAGVRPSDGRVTEGVFDGQNMIGSDGKIYSVPPNYASKSKLVEGDMLKLTITPTGSFIYKQIGPTDRARVVAALGFDPTVGEFYVADETRRWNVLEASVTYFKGEPGDEAVILVPKSGPSKWAAVENVIKKATGV